MADVNISTSDNLRITTGRWLKLITTYTDKLTVSDDLYLKKSDGSDSSIPVTSNNIVVLKNDTTFDVIGLTNNEVVTRILLATFIIGNKDVWSFQTQDELWNLKSTDNTWNPKDVDHTWNLKDKNYEWKI